MNARPKSFHHLLVFFFKFRVSCVFLYMRRLHFIYFLCLSFLVGCHPKQVTHKTPYSLVPESSQSLIRIKNISSGLSALEKHTLLQQLGSENPFLLPESLSKILGLFETKGPGLMSLIKDKPDPPQGVFVIPSRYLLWPSDSLGLSVRDTIVDNDRRLSILQTQGVTAYKTQIDSLTIIASQPGLISGLWNAKVLSDPQIQKILSLKPDKDLVITQRGPLNQWISYDLQLTPDGMSGHGVLIPSPDTPEVTHLSLGQQPQLSQAPLITPLMAKSSISLAYNKLDTLTTQLKRWEHDWTILPSVFETTDELTLIEFAEHKAVALHSLDPDLSISELAPYISLPSAYRSINLYAVTEAQKLFAPFQPLLGKPTGLTRCFVWDSFIVFTQDEDTAQQYIGLLQNKAIIAASSSYEGYQSYLAASGSLLYIALDGQLDPVIRNSFDLSEPKKLSKYPLIISQIIGDNGFAHVNFIAKSNKNKSLVNNQVQLLTTTVLDQALLTTPQFFANHKTSGKDIVVQDIGNKLYFIGANGKILWTKTLDAPILGPVQEVDILRNGKKQLAFTTPKGLYILDRNGQNVSPFPKLFKDPITQPLAIFDYDNNRKYRFVIVQGAELLMYDHAGKRVKGFAFQKTKNNLIHAPTHIRIGSKDYLLIQEDNGRLQILDRVGKTRIAVTDRFDFGPMGPLKEGNNFVFWTKDFTKISIDTNGKISRDTSTKSENSMTYSLGTNKATLDENLLRLNNRLIELPLGLYQAPQLFEIKGTFYVALHNRENNTILMLNKSGEALKNFPVYGSSSIDMADMNRNKKSNFVVQGQANEVLIYQIQ